MGNSEGKFRMGRTAVCWHDPSGRQVAVPVLHARTCKGYPPWWTARGEGAREKTRIPALTPLLRASLRGSRERYPDAARSATRIAAGICSHAQSCAANGAASCRDSTLASGIPRRLAMDNATGASLRYDAGTLCTRTVPVYDCRSRARAAVTPMLASHRGRRGACKQPLRSNKSLKGSTGKVWQLRLAPGCRASFSNPS